MSYSDHAPTANCRNCDSTEMFGPLRLYPETGMGEGHVLVATTRARHFSRPEATVLTAWACRRCGHLDLFTPDPETLFQHWSADKH